MEKYIFMSINWLIILLAFSSCEKVIDVDLNSASPKLVIEGGINDQAAPHTVKLSKTVNFNQKNVFPPVSGAFVKMYDNTGSSEVLTETVPGTYAATTLQSVPGRTYTLTITDNGKNYTATSTMPEAVTIDTLLALNLAFPEGDGLTIFIGFKDPAAIKNYYRFVQIVNGVPKNTFYVMDDKFQNGAEISFPMHDDTKQEKLKSGDSVTVLLQSIDKAVYDYFYPMYFNNGSTANPPSNFGKEALGYFSAYAVTSKTIVVP